LRPPDRPLITYLTRPGDPNDQLTTLPTTTTRTVCACCAPLSRSPTRASRTSPGRSTGRWPALARAETLKSLAYLPLVRLARAGRPWTSCELHLHCHVARRGRRGACSTAARMPAPTPGQWPREPPRRVPPQAGHSQGRRARRPRSPGRLAESRRGRTRRRAASQRATRPPPSFRVEGGRRGLRHSSRIHGNRTRTTLRCEGVVSAVCCVGSDWFTCAIRNLRLTEVGSCGPPSVVLFSPRFPGS
jgi:hypothetical protein